MYKSIPHNLTNDELTTVIHFAIKILNKYKSKENKDVNFDKLPFKDKSEKLNEICSVLLDEIGVENLRENDKELDKHINQLFSLLTDRLKSEASRLKEVGNDLLKRFGDNLSGKKVLEVGSGPGRFTQIALDLGANLYSVELSSAAFVNLLMAAS